MKAIYEHLKDHLNTIAGVNDVNYFLGQYTQEDRDSFLYDTPALFIEFLPIDWFSNSKNVQRGVLTFIIHTVTESIYDDDERILDPAIDHLDLVGKVFAKLQGHRHKNGNLVIMETIERLDTTPDHALDVVIATLQTFRCTVFSYEALPVTATAQIDTLELTPEIVPDV